MALTITATRDPAYIHPQRIGTYFETTLDWSVAGTYATNGHTYSQADLAGIPITAVLDISFPDTFRNGAAAVVPEWDKANKRVMFYGGAASGVPLAEVTNATSLAGYAGKVRIRHNP